MARKAMGPATLALHQAVTATLSATTSASRDAVVVACSGGQDSLALAVVTHAALTRDGRAVTAVVVDHGLQPGSDGVAAEVGDQLAEHGVTAVVVAVQVDRAPGTGGPEAAARTARYAALADAAARLDAQAVLLGHTLDDQAETVLLGLARGSGVRSLAGMPRSREIFRRPLLGLRRADTAAACVELGLRPWHDPHNQDPAYARVRVRDQVLPVLERELGPGVGEALARTADLARDDADALDALAAQAYAGILRDDALDCAALAALVPALRRRVLRRFLLTHGADEVGAVHLAAVTVLLEAWRGQRGVDLPGVRVVRDRDRLRAVAG